MTAAPPTDLPSRPSLVETLVVACLVVGAGAWLTHVALGALAEREERARQVRLAQQGAADGLDEADRFAARDQLVDVNVATVRAFDPDAEEEDAAADLVAVVEQLVATDGAPTEAVRAALAGLVARLDAKEAEDGFLDPALETARELAREALPEEKR